MKIILCVCVCTFCFSKIVKFGIFTDENCVFYKYFSLWYSLSLFSLFLFFVFRLFVFLWKIKQCAVKRPMKAFKRWFIPLKYLIACFLEQEKTSTKILKLFYFCISFIHKIGVDFPFVLASFEIIWYCFPFKRETKILEFTYIIAI